MSQVAANSIRWTTADLEVLEADEWKRYEIIDGELFVTRAPHIGHQDAAGRNLCTTPPLVRRDRTWNTFRHTWDNFY